MVKLTSEILPQVLTGTSDTYIALLQIQFRVSLSLSFRAVFDLEEVVNLSHI